MLFSRAKTQLVTAGDAGIDILSGSSGTFTFSETDFLNWLDNFLDSIRNDGTYELLYKRWFESTAWMKNLEG